MLHNRTLVPPHLVIQSVPYGRLLILYRSLQTSHSAALLQISSLTGLPSLGKLHSSPPSR